MRRFERLEQLAELVGSEIGCSEWLDIEQSRIDAFAEATNDRQWIHCDAERAASGPFGSTVAHGFLTLSLLPVFFETGFAVADVRMVLNYGLNKVRFPAPVPVNSRLRARFTLQGFEWVEGGAQLTVLVQIEREGSAKPVCVAESLMRQYV
ncbi:MaoC family dehydratase [Paucibacter sp. APW11]|uniref:MaoC family dehydratase n=1 Tax=Roseateles aquae TaxID=3077235 RepID=A0ABU3P9P7_9BURK|nr:MaoC family dehydratase [Paucibacter sp. APW11]MDT8999297.1 MaoC family dehydratase [Paucibacter sp. APW11]